MASKIGASGQKCIDFYFRLCLKQLLVAGCKVAFSGVTGLNSERFSKHNRETVGFKFTLHGRLFYVRTMPHKVV